MQAMAEMARADASPRILVTDDSRVARALVRAQLVAHGYEVLEACDGEEALTIARETVPDVVLLDIELPGEDGFVVLERFKADGALHHIPVVFLTRRTATEDVVRGLERGAHDYLRKPVEASELIARIHAAARAKALHDRLLLTNVELERTASTDPLTGLYNRRILDDEIDRLVARAVRHGHPFSVILLDLDRFKTINDGYGHAIGDAVLVAVAALLRENIDAEDVLGRWGGEEFVVLAPDARVMQASGLSERLCAAVAAAPIEVEAASIRLSISAGYSVWSAGDDADAMLRRADRGLYAAKDAGRGRAYSGDAVT